MRAHSQLLKAVTIRTLRWLRPLVRLRGEVFRLSDSDMKLLMIDVTNHCHKFLSELFLSARGEAIIEALKERDPVPKWYDPEGPGSSNAGAA